MKKVLFALSCMFALSGVVSADIMGAIGQKVDGVVDATNSKVDSTAKPVEGTAQAVGMTGTAEKVGATNTSTQKKTKKTGTKVKKAVGVSETPAAATTPAAK